MSFQSLQPFLHSILKALLFIPGSRKVVTWCRSRSRNFRSSKRLLHFKSWNWKILRTGNALRLIRSPFLPLRYRRFLKFWPFSSSHTLDIWMQSIKRRRYSRSWRSWQLLRLRQEGAVSVWTWCCWESGKDPREWSCRCPKEDWRMWWEVSISPLFIHLFVWSIHLLHLFRRLHEANTRFQVWGTEKPFYIFVFYVYDDLCLGSSGTFRRPTGDT